MSPVFNHHINTPTESPTIIPQEHRTMIITKGTDSSARKSALKQDTGYMVERTHHKPPYLGAFGAYLMHH